MSEQSDTPRTDAAARQAGGSSVFLAIGWRLACDLERELATAKHERDEWKLAARNQAQIVTKIARERDEARVSVDTLRAAIKTAEAALADIGDSDHEPTDDLAWCERRAQQAFPVVRFALAATEVKP